MEVREFEIPVPWGHIAAKAWGKEENTPVLTLHGAKDNAGTFDRLIPLLSDSFYYICIDFPSHGKSTFFPPYVVITAIDFIFAVKFVTDYLNRGKYIFMGHSLGAQVSTIFAQLFPEIPIKLIALDAIFFNPVRIDKIVPLFRKKFEATKNICDNASKIEQMRYKYNEARANFISDRCYTKFSEEAADALLKRCLVKLSDGSVRFSHDPRLESMINFTFDAETLTEQFTNHPVTCPVSLILSEESKARVPVVSETLKVLQQKSKHCVISYVDGGHYLHINNAEIVASIINNFLIYNKCKL